MTCAGACPRVARSWSTCAPGPMTSRTPATLCRIAITPWSWSPARKPGRNCLTWARHGTSVFAGPDFDLPAAKHGAPAPAGTAVAVLTRGPSPELRGRTWAPLPGAAAEADDLRRLLDGSPFGPVRTYAGPEATEEALKALRAPRVLHLATHGFFLPRRAGADLPAAAGAGPTARLQAAADPLLRSGL